MVVGVLAGLVTLVSVAVLALYLWPLERSALQQATATTLDFTAAEEQAQRAVLADTADGMVTRQCRTQLLSHGKRTAKAVLLLHGYRSCPKAYDALAQEFFKRGYNVYVPRESRHGLVDDTASNDIKAEELVEYANDGMNIVAGLGVEAGIVGISGGGVLATWLAHYRGDAVARLLVLSPFYRPGASRAPAFAVRPFTLLFGFGLVPDRITGEKFSFRALAQYQRVVFNYADRPQCPVLRTVAAVVSPNDELIDRRVAFDVPTALAQVNPKASIETRELPAGFGLDHDILDPDVVPPDRQPDIYRLYVELYEGTAG
ncbi:serine aminopeptidase domain-containing protein [Phytohabitans flavus]|uniref:serine aminopeptidase domain-containing protein n=1 Tax=Phytohabitans flavus TaxID=1076124 RepID=UPI0015662DEC|nr:alpha/beta hydrolase [Phytohabitans flavus]